MSFSIVYTRAMCGTDAPRVRVETHLSNGLPSFSLVGLPEAAVKESRERVRSALLNCGFEFPMRRLTLNLAPADLPKEGGRFDLAIAIGILVASGQIDASRVEGAEFLAELALNGEICSVRGVLPSLLAAENQAKCMFVSTDDQQYSRMIESNKIFGAKDLLSLVQYLREPDAYPLPICGAPATSHDSSERQEKDLADVAGQHAAKHALEVAASGGHNLLFYGPPGTGKSMLASRITSILPRLSTKDALDVASLYTLTDSPRSMAEWERPPYRAPHHSCSSVALVGGGVKPKPGEASLAHKGVLFLDH